MAQIYKTTIDWTATGKTILGITASSPEAARDIASGLAGFDIGHSALAIYEGEADWDMLRRLHNHKALRVETRVAFEDGKRTGRPDASQ